MAGLAQSQGHAGKSVLPLLSCAGMRSQTPVRRRRTEAATIESGNERASPQVRAAVVGLAGLDLRVASGRVV
jgi:hypothetical protein